MDKYQALLWGILIAASAAWVWARMAGVNAPFAPQIYMRAAAYAIMISIFIIWMLAFFLPSIIAAMP